MLWLETKIKSDGVPEKLFPLFPAPPSVKVLLVDVDVALKIRKVDVPFAFIEPAVAEVAVNVAFVVILLNMESVETDRLPVFGFQLEFVLKAEVSLDPTQKLCEFV